MSENKGMVDRSKEGFIIPDTHGVLHVGDMVEIIESDGSSKGKVTIQTTLVGGQVGKPGFVNHISALDENEEEIKIFPGTRVKWIGEKEPIEIIDPKNQ